MYALMVLKCEFFFKEICNCITLSLSKSKNKKHMQVKHLTLRMLQKIVALKFLKNLNSVKNMLNKSCSEFYTHETDRTINRQAKLRVLFFNLMSYFWWLIHGKCPLFLWRIYVKPITLSIIWNTSFAVTLQLVSLLFHTHEVLCSKFWLTRWLS
jgi:hypothetical protein